MLQRSSLRAAAAFSVACLASAGLGVTLFGAGTGVAEAAEAAEGHPLLGKEAPQFRLKTSTGKSFSLDKALERGVVVLDFWATWCPPCVAGLPVLDRVVSETEGAELFAVNLREDADTVNRFLKQKKIQAPSLMDTTGEVGGAYHARSIPQTVIILPDGRVHTIHVGAAPEQRIREDLESAVTAASETAEASAPATR